MIKEFIWAVLFFGIANVIMAQNVFSLRGSLIDERNEALPFTNCVLLQQSDSTFAYGTTSDFDGVFSLTGIKENKYILRISAIGHKTYFQDITIRKDMVLDKIKIAGNATLLKTVQITATRPLYSADGEKVFYNVADDPSVKSGNATDALQNAPGVEVDAEGNIKYRGGTEVSIWINDKPSHLKAEGLKQYLKSLPAGTLQRIEVIAHPSAKYHTKNCVINIITTAKVRRNELLCIGLNGNSRPQIGTWADYVISNEKTRFNIFVSGDYDKYTGENSINSSLLSPNGTLSSDLSTHSHSKNRTLNGNFGLDFDYYLDTSTTINLWLWATAAHDSTHRDSRTERIEHIYNTGRYFYNEEGGKGSTMAEVAFGIMMEKKIDTLGGMIFFDYTGTLTRNRTFSNIQRTHDSITYLNFNRRNIGINPSQWHGITTDIAMPYNKYGEIDFGIMASLAPEHKDVDETDNGITDPVRSYSYRNGNYELSIYAGAKHHFGQLTLEASLSCDNAWHNLLYPDADSGNVKKHYLTISPTFHASYSTKTMHNFTFSYTHNITPPNANQITSFTIYDYDSYSTGNAHLRNGYTNKIELGWERYFDNLGSIGINAWFNSDRDRIGTLTDVAYCDQFGRIVAFSKPFNIGVTRQGGLGLNATLRPIDFMNIRFYANIFDDYYNVQYRPGQWQKSEMLCYSLRINFWTKLWNKLQIFANTTYRSKTQALLVETAPYFVFDCGISTDLFDNRLSIFLNINDVFGTVRSDDSSINPYNPSVSASTTESRYISLGLTWRIGRTDMESKQTHDKKKSRKKER